jgi:hypothetical protein
MGTHQGMTIPMPWRLLQARAQAIARFIAALG